MKTIAILNYGIGNIRSVSNALTALGAAPDITRDPARIAGADGVILPGVGAFPAGMELLQSHGLVPEIHKYVAGGKPFLGICLGMQLLFDRGTEFGDTAGLGLVPGVVDKIGVQPGEGRLPHIAWTTIARNPDVPDVMFAGLNHAQCRFYFVHSFTARDVPGQFVTGSTFYLDHPVTAAVQRGNVWGTQFHPEKSGPSGLKLLTNFIDRC
jgi:glutamine amidotransferase